jgi:hypothetical protein
MSNSKWFRAAMKLSTYTTRLSTILHLPVYPLPPLVTIKCARRAWSTSLITTDLCFRQPVSKTRMERPQQDTALKAITKNMNIDNCHDAASKVFAIAELLEEVLLLVDVRTVVRLRRVNTAFRNTVDQSPELQRSLHRFRWYAAQSSKLMLDVGRLLPGFFRS